MIHVQLRLKKSQHGNHVCWLMNHTGCSLDCQSHVEKHQPVANASCPRH